MIFLFITLIYGGFELITFSVVIIDLSVLESFLYLSSLRFVE